MRAAIEGTSASQTEILNRVLESQCFANAPSLRALLLYLWEHRDDSISEYAIATEALGRQDSFDAKIDATVRVQISRLRQRLDKFYNEEGRQYSSRVSIPLGTHQVKVMHAAAEQAALPVLAAQVLVPVPARLALRSPKPYLLWLVALLATICIAEAFWFQHQRTAARALPATPQLRSFWKSFLSNGLPTRVILPSPTFLSFKASGRPGHSLMFRDTEANDFETATQVPLFRQLGKTLGVPSLAENYTVTSDTFASIRLVRYLDSVGVHSTVARSFDAPLEALDRENVIAIGTWGTLASLGTYLDRLQLKLVAHESAVRSEGAKPEEYRSITESPDRAIWPGVIAVMPGDSKHGHLLIIASRTTAGLVSFLTTAESLSAFEQMWTKHGSPEFFEMIVNTELRGDGVVRSWPVTLKTYVP
jgi:hypothetical protein